MLAAGELAASGGLRRLRGCGSTLWPPSSRKRAPRHQARSWEEKLQLLHSSFRKLVLLLPAGSEIYRVAHSPTLGEARALGAPGTRTISAPAQATHHATGQWVLLEAYRSALVAGSSPDAESRRSPMAPLEDFTRISAQSLFGLSPCPHFGFDCLFENLSNSRLSFPASSFLGQALKLSIPLSLYIFEL